MWSRKNIWILGYHNHIELWLSKAHWEDKTNNQGKPKRLPGSLAKQNYQYQRTAQCKRPRVIDQQLSLSLTEIHLLRKPTDRNIECGNGTLSAQRHSHIFAITPTFETYGPHDSAHYRSLLFLHLRSRSTLETSGRDLELPKLNCDESSIPSLQYIFYATIFIHDSRNERK